MSKSQPQQQPLPQSIILGCNAFNCASKISNANWETKLNEQVNVNQGDSIGVKASFIDTRGTASGNIVITKDTEISLEYYFYWMHTFNACNGEVLNLPNTTPDTSNNLTQQVLVGRSIPELYTLAKTNNIDASGGFPIPAYIVNDKDTPNNYSYTPINDADALPYVVYQSSNVIPVPTVFGPTIPACEIVAGTSYAIVTAGLSTNWAYAGVPDATKNILPPNWPLNTQIFFATANPNGVDVPPANPFYDNPGMPPSAFLLPADVLPTLPYVTYMITFVGSTDWITIDPNYATTYISASQMIPGVEYAIDNPGNLNWVALGAASNAPGEEFVYTPPPDAPPDFPITLNNAFFLANAGAFINPGQTGFGTSPDDNFQCVIGVDGNGDYTLVSYSGSGAWCNNISNTAYWYLAPALFGVSTAVCPTATALTITGFSATSAGVVAVADLIAGEKYSVATTGVLDPSNPPFTWNMVSNLPTTDTSLMVSGNQYQVYEYNGTVIPYATNQGVLTDVFISQGPIAIEPINGLYYENGVTPNIYTVVTITVDGVAVPMNSNWQVQLNVTADANGNCQINFTNEDGLLYNTIDAPPFATAQTIITTINGQAQTGLPPINVSFISTAADGDFDSTTITNFRQTATLVPFPSNTIPSKLVQLQGLVPSTATYTYNLTTPDIADIYFTGLGDGIQTPASSLTTFSVTLSANPNGNGYVYWVPYPVSVCRGPDWSTYTAAFICWFESVAAQPGDFIFDGVFDIVSSNATDILSAALFLNPGVTSPYFPTMLAPLTFTASGPYTGTGSTSTANGLFGTLTAATVSGTGYLQGSVYNTPPKVGSIIKSLFADPSPGSSGLAAEYPSPFDVSGVVYDGTVKPVITPATYKTDIRPVKKKWKMMLKAGSYDPNYLAESITRSMSRQKIKRVNNVKNGPLSTNGTQSTLNIPSDSIWDNDVSGNVWASPSNAGSNTFYDAKNLKVYGFPSETDYNIDPDNDDMPFLFVPAMNGSALHDNQQSNTDYIYAEIPHPNAQTLNFLPPPAYYINLVPLLSDVKSVSPTIPPDISGNDYYTILPFYSQNCTPAGNSAILPIAYGATQSSLVFNNEGDGRFQFNYLHSPILAFLSSNTNDLTECTAHMYTAQAVGTNLDSTLLFTSLIDKKSGVLLNKMEPTSFWSALGFDIPSLTVDLDNKPPGFQMTLNEFESKTTGGFCGSSNIFNANFKTSRSADQPSCPDTENLFLSVLIPNNQEPTIAAYAPGILNYSYTGLMPGSTYKIVNPGTWYDNNNPPTTQDWSFCGGPSNAAAGDIFVARLTTNPSWVFAGCGVWPGYPVYVPNQSDPNPSLPSYRGDGDWGNATCVLYNNKPNTTNTQLQNNYFEVQNTNTLNAVKIPTVRDQTGHFLIEITGYNGVYLDDKSKREIKSIVSSYFVSQGSFVAQVFPESYNYYHVGSPISLSNLKIRILDPFTMEEAQIGPNSSVYIQVNKMLSDIAIAQVEN